MKNASGTVVNPTHFRTPLPRVPEVRSPWPSRLNRYTGEAERRALHWARRIGLIGPAEAAVLAGQRFGQLAGRCHPDFGLSRLTDICRWYLWFAVLDDRYCDRREQPAEAARLSQRLAVISQVLDDPGTVTADPVAVAAADLVRRTRQRATEARDFRPRPSRLCGWCAHQARCPAFDGTPPPFPQRPPAPAPDEDGPVIE